MIVFKITYDTSVVADFAPTFNNGWGYDYTTKTSTSGTLKTVTYESDTVFTAISIPNNNRNCVKSIYIDASGMTNLYGTFTSCQSMTDFTIVNATSKLTNLYQTTYDCTILANITYENCDLSGVTNIQNVFNNGARDVVTNATFKNVKFNNTTKSMISILCKATTMVVEDCDFSSVTSFYQMFYKCVGLKGTLDLSTYDFTNVYEAHQMFYGCTNLAKIIMPKGTFDKLTNCGNMFQDCTSLVEVDLSGFHIPNAQNMSYMFSGCGSIEEIDCSGLGVLNPTNINHMFVSCQKLKRVNLSGIKVSKGISFSHMFYDSTVVEWIDISNIISRASDAINFWRSGTVVKNIGMLYCPADVINAFARDMVSSGRTCNIYYHDAKLEDLAVDSRFNYIYCEEYHGDVVTTPDDLKLHGLSDVQDTLDLTTGTYTQRVKKWNLAEEGYTFINVYTGQEAQGYVRFQFRQRQFSNFGNPWCISNKATHINNLGLPNLNEGLCASNLGRCLGVAANNAFLMLKLKTTDVTSYDKAGLDEWIKVNNFTIYYNAVFNGIDSSIKTETYQVNINPLKSYYNGSIQTSSQQLTPTLKTTLPISNKFTTTNLTSGSTYNVYFDGTATKLDAGGTIITDPVSPCEVECGGTTLTIEGTDIQNVRVLETTNKNEVGSVCGTTDVELNRVITSDLEVITNDIEFSSVGTDNGNINTVDNKLGTINTKGGHTWGAGYFTSNKTYPKGFSLLHIEFDVNMPSNNLMAIINFNNNVSNTYYNFRDLTLDNDTATIAQGQTSGIAVNYSSIVTKGHFSRLVYCFSSQGKINLNINTGSSAMLTASGNNAEGSTSGYTACANNGITISNFKIKVIENYPDATVSSQVTSSLRTDNGLIVIWQDMDMSIGQSISKLEQPIKLRSLGTTYDSYNPVTGELTKRIRVSETDGSYSVLSSPIVMETRKTEVNGYMADKNTICKEYSKGYEFNTSGQLFFSNIGHYTDYYIEIPENTKTLSFKGMSYYKRIMIYDENKKFIKCFYTYDNYGDATGNITSDMKYVRLTTVNEGSQGWGYGDMRSYLVTDTNYLVFTSDTSLQTLTIPQLYTNGQVKVYSESDVYPTTILNGQSTNNYEVNELNKSNNYTIRYEGECESINLANKSNTQGTNRIVKSGTDGRGNLTFVNNSGDIDNVLLVQNNVREQEINHFNGLQTVEINQLFVSNKQNLFEQYMKNDFEFLNNVAWGAQAYGSLHNGVFKCGNLSAGSNLQWAWNLIKPHVDNVYGSRLKEDNPIVLANKVYNISFNISIVDHHTVNGNHNYMIRAFDFDGNEVSVQKATGGQAYLEINSNGVTNPTPTKFINLDVIFSKDIYCFALHANYGGQWAFDCTITDFTICEPENAKPDVPLIYEYIDLPQPVQLNSLLDGTHDTYNPITGEYVQNVGYFVLDNTFASRWLIVKTKDGKPVAQRDLSTHEPNYSTLVRDYSFPAELYDYQTGTKAIANIPLTYNIDHTSSNIATPSLYGATYFGNHYIRIALPFTPNDLDQWNYSYTRVNDWLRENPIHIAYKRTEPIVTQLTPIEIPTFESGIVQLITTDGKVFPMVEYSMPTNNRYDTSSWETGAVYTQRNITEAYFNDSTTPMIPTETITLTTDHISSGSIILNDNGNGLIVLKGNYTGRDIPYFTGMRSVEAIEVETTPSPDQPLFGKGGRK